MQLVDRKRKKWIIIVVVVAAILGIVTYLVATRDRATQSPAPTPAPTASYPTTPPPSTSYRTTEASPTPPSATDLPGYIPAEAGGYQWEPAEEDANALEAGAVDAITGVFKSTNETLLAGLAEWPSAEDAAAWAEQRGRDSHPSQEPLTQDDINDGAGHYWYYALDDDSGAIYWQFGTFTGELTGDPYSVQEFFLSFPR